MTRRACIFAMIILVANCFAAAIPGPLQSLQDMRGGDAVCASARRQVLAALTTTSRELQRVGTAATNNRGVLTAVKLARAGMKDATNGVTQIAFTLLSGVEPTQASRNLVEKGFGGAKLALDDIKGASVTVTTRVTRAKSSLDRSIIACNLLLVDCGGSNSISVIETSTKDSATTVPATIILTNDLPNTSTVDPASTPTNTAEETSLSILTVTESIPISTAVVTQTILVPTTTSDAIPSETAIPDPDPTIVGIPEPDVTILGTLQPEITQP